MISLSHGLHAYKVYGRKPPRLSRVHSTTGDFVSYGLAWTFAGMSIIDKGLSLVASESQGLAARYASALFTLAEDERALDVVASDLINLRSLVVGNSDLRRMVRSPVLSRENQTKGISAILEKVGCNLLTLKFIGVVTMNRRLFAIESIIRAFLAELAHRRGELVAEIISAKELRADEIEAVSEKLRDTLGQKVSVNLSVDPSLIGGLIVRVGSRLIDSSIRSKLQRLQIAMKGSG